MAEEKRLNRKLESIESVASVRIGGGLKTKSKCLLISKETSQLNISISEIIQRSRRKNVNASGLVVLRWFTGVSRRHLLISLKA